MMFTIFDISIFTIIALSAMLGLYKGLLNISINLLGLTASIILAIFLFPHIKHLLIGHIENHLLISIISGIISYIFSLVVLTLVTARIITLCNFMSRGVVDRTLGLVFGIMRGFMLSVIVFAAIAIAASGAYIKAQSFDDIISNLDREKYPEYLIKSKTSKMLEKLLKKSVLFLPETMLKYSILPKAPIKQESSDIIDDIKAVKGSGG